MVEPLRRFRQTSEPSHSEALRRQTSMKINDAKDVHIIGGGLGGLAAAFVSQAGRSVVVHEQRDRLGGATRRGVAGSRQGRSGPRPRPPGQRSRSLSN